MIYIYIYIYETGHCPEETDGHPQAACIASVTGSPAATRMRMQAVVCLVKFEFGIENMLNQGAVVETEFSRFAGHYEGINIWSLHVRIIHNKEFNIPDSVFLHSTLQVRIIGEFKDLNTDGKTVSTVYWFINL